MSSLWKDVVSGAYVGESFRPSIDTATIEAVITDDPCSLSDYVGMCTENMVAMQGAVAVAEGRCAVKYLTAANESAKREAHITMEGVLRNAWEGLKDMAERAYEAIKRWIKKAWNKIKAYFNIARGMIGKYRDVLKSKADNCEVEWLKMCDLKNALSKVAGLIDSMRVNDFVTAADNEGQVSHTVNNKGGIEEKSGAQIKHEILVAIYGNNGEPEIEKVEFGSKKGEILKTIDDGVDNIYQGFFRIGDASERDVIKTINEGKKNAHDAIDDSDASDNEKSISTRVVNTYARRQINAVRYISQEGHKAATMKYRLAVKACRKAIKYQHGVRESYTPGSLESFMGEIL